ncbi:MAG: acetate kinase [Clostridia bacterium]|jgi:acetate kinase|nr:acetate kinase [Clostridia bacterium]MBQ5957093.1 acetate kinase [Clostridia bacterium]MBR6822960.1 acetate kinase [Clostridia bacterium]
MTYILVINAGSSSIKYQLIDMDNEEVKAKGLVERIGIEGAQLTHTTTGKDKIIVKKAMADHGVAMQEVIKALTDEELGAVKSMDEIQAVGHRVLHGGEKFTQPSLVDENVLDGIREYIELGPLHNPANIKGIETCMALMPGIPNVAVFDTAFHQTMPDYAYLYGIPYDAYKDHKIRKYGFHGTSHRYITMQIEKKLGRKDLRIITCHLGNGSSLAAVKDGKCIDTTMGLTPLEGLIMGTRSGDIDPTAVTYIMKKYDMTAEEVVSFLNKKSGVLGISGVSSDFRDLEAAANEGNEKAQLALNMFIYRIKKYIGAFAAALGGVDVIAFAGGIGENDGYIRSECLKGLDFLNVSIDDEANKGRGELDITGADSKVKVLVIPTNEELMIARETKALAL